jgi:RNA polymerase sigma-70 factor, ECF subfamily
MASSSNFDELYQSHYVRVFGLCRRLLNSASLAEDASQEAFMRAYKIIDKYDSSQPFWPWIATIANNYCIDLLRRRSKTQAMFGDEEAELDLIESSDSQTLTQLIDKENANALTEAIGSLPDKYRIPLVMAYKNDASYEEIAETLSISRNHVGVLLLRAKQLLREMLRNVNRKETT